MRLFWVFYLLTKIASAQDSTSYSQKDALQFSNKYTFYSTGDFKHIFRNDDGEIWLGRGIYKDRGRCRTLFFKEPERNSEAEFAKIHYETGIKRKLKKKGNFLLSKDYYKTTNNKTVIFIKDP